MTTRIEYHQKRLKKALAEAIQAYYNCHGDSSRWMPWEFEDEKRLLSDVTDRITHEDGFDIQA